MRKDAAIFLFLFFRNGQSKWKQRRKEHKEKRLCFVIALKVLTEGEKTLLQYRITLDITGKGGEVKEEVDS